MKIFDYIIEGVFYIAMVLSPVLGLGIVGGVLFLWQRIDHPNLAIVLWVVSGIVGLILGVLFAEKYRKKMPPSMFWAQLMATPELDYDVKEKQKQEGNDNDTKG